MDTVDEHTYQLFTHESQWMYIKNSKYLEFKHKELSSSNNLLCTMLGKQNIVALELKVFLPTPLEEVDVSIYAEDNEIMEL